jgi:DNA-binding transcriptional ArsR family regulator
VTIDPAGGGPATTDDVLRALAEPQRRRILQVVGDRELPAGEIADHFDITPQAVSQHLRVLREAGLLRERRAGTRRLYAIRPEPIESVRAFLDDLWPASLARLKETVERDHARPRRRGA